MPDLTYRSAWLWASTACPSLRLGSLGKRIFEALQFRLDIDRFAGPHKRSPKKQKRRQCMHPAGAASARARASACLAAFCSHFIEVPTCLPLVAQALLEAGAGVELTDGKGNTALHYAAGKILELVPARLHTVATFKGQRRARRTAVRKALGTSH